MLGPIRVPRDSCLSEIIRELRIFLFKMWLLKRNEIKVSKIFGIILNEPGSSAIERFNINKTHELELETRESRTSI